MVNQDNVRPDGLLLYLVALLAQKQTKMAAAADLAVEPLVFLAD